MIGVIIGDIAGSRFEMNNHRSREFEMFASDCQCTDDSVLSLAIAKALLECSADFSDLSAHAVRCIQEVGRKYPDCGFSNRFRAWLMTENPQPYGAKTNGCAMRVSGCAFAAGSLEQAQQLSRAVTEITHSHPEGIKGAEAVTVGVYLARTGATKDEIREVITREYYPIDFTIDSIRDSYKFDFTCEGSIPQAFQAFFESTDFESAIRGAVSVGGDSDTIAAIAGALAEVYYGVPADFRESALSYMGDDLKEILSAFEEKYPVRG